MNILVVFCSRLNVKKKAKFGFRPTRLQGEIVLPFFSETVGVPEGGRLPERWQFLFILP
jgi:hypothetical protein